MHKARLRAVVLLAPAALGIVTSIVSALALVPRVRAVEVITIVAAAFASGATLTASLIQFRQSRMVPPPGRH
jgi:hypothetical protein